MATPSPDAIRTLLDIGIGEEDAIACLKACNNNAETAAEYYFSGNLENAKSSVKWDDSVWSAGREGNNTPPAQAHTYNNDWVPSFNIQSEDVLSNSTNRLDGLKSRPPSRMSMREHASTGDGYHLAIRNFMGLQIGPQETGTRNSPTHSTFGPAQENKAYDPSQWAITVATELHEIIPEPAPQDRRRVPGAPSFLSPAGNGVIGGGITICHAIPAMRAEFLALDQVQDDYGQSDKWWNGDKIEVSRVTDAETSSKEKSFAFLMEVQRLMAFLDQSKRAYANIDSLLRYVDDDNSGLKNKTFVHFLETWDAAAKDIYPPDTPYRCNYGHTAYEVEENNHQNFAVFLVEMEPQDLTIYSPLDRMLWGAEYDDDAYLDAGDVVIVHVKNAQGGFARYSADLYLDRYSEAFLGEARQLRKDIRERAIELSAINAKLDSLEKFQKKDAIGDPEGAVLDPSKLLQATIEHYSTPVTRPIREDSSDDIPMDTYPDPTEVLKELLQKLETKVANLKASREETISALRELRLSYTDPESSPKPLVHYSLRGACLNPYKLYVLLPPRVEGDVQLTTDAPTEQWWRFDWTQTSSNGGWESTSSYNASVVEVSEVLDSISQSQEALLFYANNKAMTTPPGYSVTDPLPAPLQNFINNDNTLFLQELNPNAGSPEKKRRASDSWNAGFMSNSDTSMNISRSSPAPPGSPMKRTSITKTAHSSTETLNDGLPASNSASASIDPSLPPYPAPQAIKSWSSIVAGDGGQIREQMVELPPIRGERSSQLSPLGEGFASNRAAGRNRDRVVAAEVAGAGGVGSGARPRIPDSDFEMPDVETAQEAVQEDEPATTSVTGGTGVKPFDYAEMVRRGMGSGERKGG